MAAIILGGIGGALGGMVGGPFVAKLGYGLGSMVGGLIDSKMHSKPYQISGSRVTDLSIQTSTYGKVITTLFGQSRFAGNVIWSLPIKEQEHQSTSSRGKFGSGQKVISTNYTYTVTLAIALCEGVIDSIINIWADAKNITSQLGRFRIYKGTEDQYPDPLIEACVGIGRTPAYRGLAYIVIEDFPLCDYGNRIPNFTFEVKRKSKISSENIEVPVEDRLEAICIIPGSGEFVYDTEVQYKLNGHETRGGYIQSGKAHPINMNNIHQKADSVLSLDQLQDTCKNLKWVAPVVGWFGTSLNIGECDILPGVEFRDNVHTSPDIWKVAGKVRKEAHQITLKEDSPIYGGTVSDASILRYLDELKSRNLRIMFYPMLFVDALDKPWRGHISGKANDVDNFFNKSNGYNQFILHYAKLVKGKVDAFVIGSELKEITSIKGSRGIYPAIKSLIGLARQVKEILGDEVILTYAADWSEYHHTNGGWYNLDDLWSCDSIDVIGIDAYFPLTRRVHGTVSEEEVINGWESGEHYDFYYQGSGRSDKKKLSPAYAIKNIKYWLENYHVNPDGKRSSWVPKSKKIWFTEFGFPSVDCATNEPNVFFEPEAYDGGLPYGSKGIVDFHTQRIAINATLKKWQNSGIVEQMFLWTWDARPYPSWPALNKIWSDGNKWDKGHWVNGKFGLSLLSDILLELILKAGMKHNQVDVSKIIDVVDGFILDDIVEVRDVIGLLAKVYFFDVVELDGKLNFISRKCLVNQVIDSMDLIYNSNKNLLQITMAEEQVLPQKTELLYLDKTRNYCQNVSRVENHHTHSRESVIISSNIVLSRSMAEEKCEIMLEADWSSRFSYKFLVPFKYIMIRPGDVVELKYYDTIHNIKVINASLVNNRNIEIVGRSENQAIYNHTYKPDWYNSVVTDIKNNHYIAYILDLPARIGAFEDNAVAYIAVAATAGKFSSLSLYQLEHGEYNHLTNVIEESTIGTAHEMLLDASCNIFDYKTSITVTLISGSLKSVTIDQVLSGANLAIIGEEIVQFQSARLISENQYILSGLLRGRMATERFIASHVANERFVLLDNKLAEIKISPAWINHPLKYRLVPESEMFEDIETKELRLEGNGFKPLAPVNIDVTELEGKIKISWIRRTRIGGGLRDYVEVLLGEDKEEYEVDLFADEALLATIKSDIPEIILEKSLFKRASNAYIYQVSSVVGRGIGCHVALMRYIDHR